MRTEIALQNLEVEEEIQEVDENLEILMICISDISVDDLPRRYQHHTIGVSIQFGILLRRVSRAVMCYHENEE